MGGGEMEGGRQAGRHMDGEMMVDGWMLENAQVGGHYG